MSALQEPQTSAPATSPVIRRHDYQPPSHQIDEVNLRFVLGEDETRVFSQLKMRQTDAGAKGVLALDGEELELLSVSVDGRKLESAEYRVHDKGLELSGLPEAFTVDMEIRIHPESNTALEGLYQSSGNFCTQCEAQGFRRISYFLDRPDVMAKYRVRIEGDKEKYPVMLSNGNRVNSGDLDEGRHFVEWEDPFLKPSYLFALVAGDLRCHRGEFKTMSGRKVDLEIWVEPENIKKCDHALQSLIKSMRWDEDRFGREYDLDIYMIVAVNDFNMGAMENKGLNVFNSKFVLADPESATDEDYEGIESVIAHEYFHNWTGNRVTCRDWFQLTLKEGLTVFRDQEFSADLNSAAVKRIDDVKVLRSVQFAEDAGPMAHSIRPESYVEINNFYTATVYNKGAEVIRMYQSLLGKDGFRKGMDLYFERHDGQAVTCDDFRQAMADANGFDLTQFENWYKQAGTPVVQVQTNYDAQAQRYELELRQYGPETLTEDYRLRHMPIQTALLDQSGTELAAEVVELKEASQKLSFDGIAKPPVLSILRGFSAPVSLQLERSRDELATLAAVDKDSFSRWDAAQTLALSVLLELAEAYQKGDTELAVDSCLLDAWGRIVEDPALDGSFRSLLLELPDDRVLAAAMKVVDIEAIVWAKTQVAKAIVGKYGASLLAFHEANLGQSYGLERKGIDRRRLANTALDLLAHGGHSSAAELAGQKFEQANNMTDKQGALMTLCRFHEGRGAELREKALTDFHAEWKNNPLVLDKWFSVQALSPATDALDRVVALSEHSDYVDPNPNRLRALIGMFSNRNLPAFHHKSGRGYRLLADEVMATDRKNPQVAARIVSAFNQWKRYDNARQDLQQVQLRRIFDAPETSSDVKEIVGRALG